MEGRVLRVMAKFEQSKMTVSLDSESKRVLRNLTRAIDRLARGNRSEISTGSVKRLSEPADDLVSGEGQSRTGQRNICGND